MSQLRRALVRSSRFLGHKPKRVPTKETGIQTLACFRFFPTLVGTGGSYPFFSLSLFLSPPRSPPRPAPDCWLPIAAGLKTKFVKAWTRSTPLMWTKARVEASLGPKDKARHQQGEGSSLPRTKFPKKKGEL